MIEKIHKLLAEYSVHDLISITCIIAMMVVIFEMIYNGRIMERSNALMCILMISFCLTQFYMLKNNLEFRRIKENLEWSSSELAALKKDLDILLSHIDYNKEGEE